LNDLLEPQGEWDNPNGGKFLIYSHPALESGESMELKLYGEPQQVPDAPDTAAHAGIGSVETSAPSRRISNMVIGIGILGGIGLILIGAGVWVWRRSLDEADEDEDLEGSGFSGLLDQVIDLDEAFEQEKIGQEQYIQDRSALNEHIRQAIDQWEMLHKVSVERSNKIAQE
jgi:hypothetical protein